MAENPVTLERQKLGVLSPRMAELLPFVADAGHARQGPAHLRRTFAAAHHDPVVVIIELAGNAFFERGKERDTNMTSVYDSAWVPVLAQAERRLQCGLQQRLRRGRHRLAGKMPKAVARIAPVDFTFIPQAYPDAALRIVTSIQPLRRLQQLACPKIFFEG